jgi:hypothetical protein
MAHSIVRRSNAPLIASDRASNQTNQHINGLKVLQQSQACAKRIRPGELCMCTSDQSNQPGFKNFNRERPMEKDSKI